MMTFEIKETAPNRFKCTFDCLNPGEWVAINFFTTGEPVPAIFTSGRLHGQNAQFQSKTDDSILSWPERVGSLLFGLYFALSPVALASALVWAYGGHHLVQLFSGSEKLPSLLNGLFLWGVTVPILHAMYRGLNWLKRRRNPKGYPIAADFGVGNAPLRFFFIEAIKGVRFGQSDSLHSYGKIRPYSKPHRSREPRSRSKDRPTGPPQSSNGH
jgi:hypothetical protein